MTFNKKLAALIFGLLLLTFTACSPTEVVPDTTTDQVPPVESPGEETPLIPVTTEPVVEENPLANTRWRLVSFGEPGAETPVLDDTTVTLEFDEAGQAGGSGGCNSYGVQYQVQGDVLSFTELTSTLIACIEAGVTEQEQRYFQTLETAGRYELSEDSLTIWYDNESGVLNFVPQTAAVESATPAATGTAQPTTAVQQTVAAPPVGESGVLSPDEFTIGTVAGVADSWFVTTVNGTPIDPNQGPVMNGLPPHLFVTFEEENMPEADATQFDVRAPQGRIFPVEAFREMYDQAGIEVVGERIDELETILEDRPEAFDTEIPVLPLQNAAQDLRAKISYIDFTGGSGVGFIARYSQGINPVTNEDLVYFFQGLTSDGQHYLSFVQPLDADFLPENFNDVPQETLDALQADPEAYLQEVTQTIDEAGSADFTPNLDALTGMYASIVIGAPAAGTPVPGTTATPTPAGTPGPGGGTATGVAPTVAAPTSAAPGITGFLWTWQELREAGAGSTSITEPVSYTLTLQSGGNLAVRADCNQGSGRYTLGGNRSISITLGTMTLVACPAGSLSEQYLDLLERAESYELSGNRLALNLRGGEDQMVFSIGQREIGVTEQPESGDPTVTAIEPLNILSGPGSQYPSYGVVPSGTVLEVAGKSPDGAWWAVNLPANVQGEGYGWVAARFVEAENTEDVPVIQPPPAP